MSEIERLADAADMIVAGYAFTKDGDLVRVINLDNLNSTAVIDRKDKIIETTMCDIEIEILKEIYNINKKYLEDYSA